MFTLKSYQRKALDTVDSFFRQHRVLGRAEAWKQSLAASGAPSRPYNDEALGEVSSVCIRIPTGGGKTFLAANAIPRIAEIFCDTDAPVVLWLVPSDAIRAQTLAGLKTPRHPIRAALEAAFGDRLRVCALDELGTVGRHEVGHSAIIVVATIQAFNVAKENQRNVYSFDEALAAHFQLLAPGQEAALQKVGPDDVEGSHFLTKEDVGRVKASLANWLAMTRPIVIVDEAHNNRTEQAYRTIGKMNPACVLELTATPAVGSNVVFHVGAQALAAEHMVKLPIVLMEHTTGWKDAIRDAVLTRDRLHELARQEAEYLRPLMLIQTEQKGGEATVDAVVAHLIADDGEKIPREQIAIATGSIKELVGVDLADPACPIRYVVTVEALKEGWDCPFAYVLCGLQDVKSAKDVEQLLGRVLRMPYATPRRHPDLSKAYAHIVAASFAEVANALVDRLVTNMGFEAYEAVSAIVAPGPQGTLGLPNVGGTPRPQPADLAFALPSMPKVPLPPELAARVEIRPTMNGATAFVTGELSEADEAALLEGFKASEKPAIRESIEKERHRQALKQAPGLRGILFAPIPQLVIDFEGVTQKVEERLLSILGEFDLFSQPVSLAGFSVQESGDVFEIDIDGNRVVYTASTPAQLQLNETSSHWDEKHLLNWLDRECRQADISQARLMKWLLKTVAYLRDEKHMPLTALIRGRYQLKAATEREINRRRRLAVTLGFQASIPLFRLALRLEDVFDYTFSFPADPQFYPARPPYYRGAYKFKKHYYGNTNIHDLHEKTGSGAIGEEFTCAQAIDLHSDVKHWVRNVEREKELSFKFPTSTDFFYPDFVAELVDGRVLVVEYKGEFLATTDDSKEKNQIGHQWEKSSKGRCLFLFAVKDADGRDVRKQLDDKIAGRG